MVNESSDCHKVFSVNKKDPLKLGASMTVNYKIFGKEHSISLQAREFYVAEYYLKSFMSVLPEFKS